MMNKTIGSFFIKYVIITVASFFYGVGVTLFLDPNNVVPGGLTGISIIFSRFIPLQIGTILLILNIPIFIIGLKKFGFRFLFSSIYATFAISIFTNILKEMLPLTKSMFLASIMGNVLIAVSLAIIFRCDATTGGTDIVVKLLRLKYPHIRTGNLFLISDIIIICFSGIIFKNLDAVFYAFMGVFILSIVIDTVLYGRDEAKMIFIISDHDETIAKKILDEADVGVTYLNGQGAYSGRKRNIILCVVKKNLSIKVENIVKETDPSAFMIITNATEIYGEGYKDIFASKL